MGATTDQINANLAQLGFTNSSNTALSNKIAQGLGIVVDNTIQEFSNSENRILSAMSTKNYGKAAYYTAKALAFQYGDNLSIDPVTLDYFYAVINAQNQIIAQAAFEEIENGDNIQNFLKIATLDGLTGNLAKLSTPQLSAFASYFKLFRLPGIKVTIVSNDPNILNFIGVMTYFTSYDLSALKTALASALTSFRQKFPFDGVFYDGDISSYVRQNVPGVRDFFVSNTTIDGNAFAGSSNLPAGYFNYPDTLFDSITYNPVS